MYIIIYQIEASNTSCTFYFVNKLTINTRDTFYTIYQGSMRDDTPCILLTSWQSVCNWQLSHVYFYTTCSQLQTPCKCILADSKCQMDPRRQCTPSIYIHNVQYSVHELTMNMVYIFWQRIRDLYAWLFVDSPYTIFTMRTLWLAFNCKIKFIFLFHILYTLRILVNINKISEGSIKQRYHNITFVSPCINTVACINWV